MLVRIAALAMTAISHYFLHQRASDLEREVRNHRSRTGDYQKAIEDDACLRHAEYLEDAAVYEQNQKRVAREGMLASLTLEELYELQRIAQERIQARNTMTAPSPPIMATSIADLRQWIEQRMEEARAAAAAAATAAPATPAPAPAPATAPAP